MSEPVALPAEIQEEMDRRAQLSNHQSKLNAYTCRVCHGTILTVDLVEGVTPMFLGCRKTPGCTGTSVSAGYPQSRPPAELGEPSHEWYRPDQVQFDAMPAEMQDHVLRGGLAIRERS